MMLRKELVKLVYSFFGIASITGSYLKAVKAKRKMLTLWLGFIILICGLGSLPWPWNGLFMFVTALSFRVILENEDKVLGEVRRVNG